VQIRSLSDFDWTFNPKLPKARLVELATARFVRTRGGVLIIEPPGLGKAHLATAIAVGAIRAGHRALERSVFDLVQDFAEAEATGERRAFVQQLTRVDLLVLEDFGMKKLGPAAAEDLLKDWIGIVSRSGGTATTCSAAPQSIPAACGWSRASAAGEGRALGNVDESGASRAAFTLPRPSGNRDADAQAIS
jgi:hypothetical protein